MGPLKARPAQVALQNGTFRNAKRAVLGCETCRLARQGGTFRMAFFLVLLHFQVRFGLKSAFPFCKICMDFGLTPTPTACCASRPFSRYLRPGLPGARKSRGWGFPALCHLTFPGTAFAASRLPVFVAAASAWLPYLWSRPGIVALSVSILKSIMPSRGKCIPAMSSPFFKAYSVNLSLDAMACLRSMS